MSHHAVVAQSTFVSSIDSVPTWPSWFIDHVPNHSCFTASAARGAVQTMIATAAGGEGRMRNLLKAESAGLGRGEQVRGAADAAPYCRAASMARLKPGLTYDYRRRYSGLLRSSRSTSACVQRLFSTLLTYGLEPESGSRCSTFRYAWRTISCALPTVIVLCWRYSSLSRSDCRTCCSVQPSSMMWLR